MSDDYVEPWEPIDGVAPHLSAVVKLALGSDPRQFPAGSEAERRAAQAAFMHGFALGIAAARLDADWARTTYDEWVDVRAPDTGQSPEEYRRNVLTVVQGLVWLGGEIEEHEG